MWYLMTQQFSVSLFAVLKTEIVYILSQLYVAYTSMHTAFDFSIVLLSLKSVIYIYTFSNSLWFIMKMKFVRHAECYI